MSEVLFVADVDLKRNCEEWVILLAVLILYYYMMHDIKTFLLKRWIYTNW